jgi:hypothetical protein
MNIFSTCENMKIVHVLDWAKIVKEAGSEKSATVDRRLHLLFDM